MGSSRGSTWGAVVWRWRAFFRVRVAQIRVKGSPSGLDVDGEEVDDVWLARAWRRSMFRRATMLTEVEASWRSWRAAVVPWRHSVWIACPTSGLVRVKVAGPPPPTFRLTLLISPATRT